MAAAHALREEALDILNASECKYIFFSYWEPPIMLLPHSVSLPLDEDDLFTLVDDVVQSLVEGIMWTDTYNATLALLQIYECSGQLVSSDCVGKAAHCDPVDTVQRRFQTVSRRSTSEALTVQVVSMPLVFSAMLEGIDSAMDLSVFLCASVLLKPAHQRLCHAGGCVCPLSWIA
eukprot:4152175-Prymnesium_polylepis.2